FDEATRFLRIAPGAKDLENAASISVPELTAGDRILARGRSSGDTGSFAATSIIVISKTDLASKHAAERAEWEKRGVGGVITALDPAAKQITINLPPTAARPPPARRRCRWPSRPHPRSAVTRRTRSSSATPSPAASRN